MARLEGKVAIVTDQWPNYDVYQTRTDRVIPLVVLSPR